MKKAAVLGLPTGILEAALAKERASYRFYERIEQQVYSVEFVRELVTRLKDEEAKHICMIEDMIARMSR